jgi:hypothetical protein
MIHIEQMGCLLVISLILDDYFHLMSILIIYLLLFVQMVKYHSP